MKNTSEIKTRFTPSEDAIEEIRERSRIRELRRKGEPTIEGVPRLKTEKNVRKALDANIEGMEHLAKKLDLTRKKILNVILTDYSTQPEPEYDKEPIIFRRLRAACGRAGMRDGGDKEREFFNTLADPDFAHVVKSVGTGLIGMYVVPLLSEQLNMALDPDSDPKLKQGALDRLFAMVGLRRDKYDFYLQRVAYNKTDVNVQNVQGDMNLEGKSTDELKAIVGSFVELDEDDSGSTEATG